MNNSHEKKARRIATLLAGYMRDNLTPAEHDELDEWVGASDKNMRLFEELTDERRVQLALELLNDNNQSGLVKKLKEDKDFKYPERRPSRLFKRISFAASIIIGLGVGGYFLYPAITGKSNDSGKFANIDKLKPLEIVPAGEFAVLTTYNDEKITLDNSKNGTIVRQGNMEVEKIDGGIRYAVRGTSQNTELRNRLTTPKGGIFNVELPDGSKAFLNTNSSISYPAYFIGADRRVSITGEVYFEIAHANEEGPNKGKPFYVEVPDRNMTIKVLGTHFNVKAYTDENNAKTTLFQGSVQITAGEKNTMLIPGEEAMVKSDGSIEVSQADMNSDMAWRSGMFMAKQGNPIPALQAISRWYNLDLVIHNTTNKTLTSSYSGPLNLKNSLETNLKTFDISPRTNIKVEGRQLIITVTPS